MDARLKSTTRSAQLAEDDDGLGALQEFAACVGHGATDEKEFSLAAFKPGAEPILTGLPMDFRRVVMRRPSRKQVPYLAGKLDRHDMITTCHSVHAVDYTAKRCEVSAAPRKAADGPFQHLSLWSLPQGLPPAALRDSVVEWTRARRVQFAVDALPEGVDPTAAGEVVRLMLARGAIHGSASIAQAHTALSLAPGHPTVSSSMSRAKHNAATAA